MKTKNKKLKIIKAVEKLAKTHTFDEIKLDDVARLAEVGKGTLYLYFKDKDDLFAQVTLNGSEELCELIDQHTASDNAFIEKLYAVCQVVSDFFVHRHSLLRLMHEYEVRSGTHSLSNKSHQRENIFCALVKVLQQGVSEQKLSSLVPLETQAVFLLGLLRTRDWSFKRHNMETPPVKMAVDIFLNGMKR
jgi:TetR/AcrR family transcriptional regulator